jgi:hypothetical protein
MIIEYFYYSKDGIEFFQNSFLDPSISGGLTERPIRIGSWDDTEYNHSSPYLALNGRATTRDYVIVDCKEMSYLYIETIKKINSGEINV